MSDKTDSMFLSGITRVKKADRTISYGFTLVQASGGAVRLEYQSWEEALSERKALVASNDSTFIVPNPAMFEAIRQLIAMIPGEDDDDT